MRVFLTGATGYIGWSVARALRRAGHEVHGLCRSDGRANAVARGELLPVVGDVTQPQDWIRAAESCSVLVHAAADPQNGAAADRAAIAALLDAAESGPGPKTLVYTSGVWVYGSTGRRAAEETDALAPLGLVSWRPAHERMVLEASHVKGLVLRPGCVYGGRGGLTGMWFAGALREETVRVVGDGTNRWAMVHADDLADAYVRAIESGIHGEVFNVVDRSRDTVGEMAGAAAQIAGRPGAVRHVTVAEASQSLGAFAEALAVDQHVDARKAVRRLGWQPRHGGFVDGIAGYFAAWAAHQ